MAMDTIAINKRQLSFDKMRSCFDCAVHKIAFRQTFQPLLFGTEGRLALHYAFYRKTSQMYQLPSVRKFDQFTNQGKIVCNNRKTFLSTEFLVKMEKGTTSTTCMVSIRKKERRVIKKNGCPLGEMKGIPF